MRAVSINVYEFDELSSEVQKKVIDRYRDAYVDIEDAMNIEFINHVGDLDFTLSYSLSCCQGDGVSFTGMAEGKEEVLKLANLVYGGEVPKKILSLINSDIIYKVEFNRISSHYVHKYTVATKVIVDGDYLLIAEDFKVAITHWYSDICDALETYGYNTIDTMRSDDYVREGIIANYLEFTENGDDFRCYG